MANPQGYSGRGTVLSFSLDTTTWTPVPQIQQFEPVGSKQVKEDQTNLSSPGNFTQPFAVQVDSGEITIAGLYSGAVAQLQLGSYHAAMTLLYWQAQLVDGSFYTFQAYVSEFKPFSAKWNKLYTWSAKLRVTGGGLQTSLSAFDGGAFDSAAFATT
jgi:hypothetical protein